MKIPWLLSFMAHGDPQAEVKGLDSIPAELHPPVAITHYAFQIMVGLGMLMMLLAFIYFFAKWKRKKWLQSNWLLKLFVLATPDGIYCRRSRMDSDRSWPATLDHLWHYENSGCGDTDAGYPLFVLPLYRDLFVAGGYSSSLCCTGRSRWCQYYTMWVQNQLRIKSCCTLLSYFCGPPYCSTC